MTAFDYANQVVELDHRAPDYRQQVEKVLRRWAADELCRVASVIDEQDRKGEVRFPPEAAQICRKEADAHLYHT